MIIILILIIMIAVVIYKNNENKENLNISVNIKNQKEHNDCKYVIPWGVSTRRPYWYPPLYTYLGNCNDVIDVHQI